MVPFRSLFATAALICALAAHGGDSPVQVTDELAARQPAMIDRQIQAVAGHAMPGAQGYFVGFAGVGEERVFAQEIDLAARRFADRFGLEQRSLRLVNDQRDLEKYPLASAGGLRHALLALGRVMDQDDVLFLVLSSHGWKDATISITNVGMQPTSLGAAQLADMLRESGIRWRVIMISACFSGSFIKPLADNHTIVITAASKSRPSFGCGAESELTYFGEAFYRDALPSAPSLRAAFETARREITAREKAERVRPSHPQGYFAPLMETKLAEMKAVSP
jgi:hypothetical protein